MLILGGIGIPFPEDATFILCGFLIERNMIKTIPALLVIYIGVLISDFIIYLLAENVVAWLYATDGFKSYYPQKGLPCSKINIRRKESS